MSDINYDELFSFLGFTKEECIKLANSMTLGAVRHCGKIATTGAVGYAVMAGGESLKVGQGMSDKRLAAGTAVFGGLIVGGILFTACKSIKRQIENEIATAMGKSKGISTSALVAKMTEKQKKIIAETAKELLRLDIPIKQKLEEQRRWEHFGA